MMLKKSFNVIETLLFSIICIIIGILTILLGKTFFKYDIYLIATITVLITTIDTIRIIFNYKDIKQLILGCFKLIIEFIFAALMIYCNEIILASLTVFFGFYIFIHSILHLFNLYLYQINGIKGKLTLLNSFIITLILSILLISNPNKNIFFAQIIIGTYLIFLGMTRLIDFFGDIIPAKYSNFFKSHIQIQLPILLAMFIPKQLISIINESLEISDNSKFKAIKQNIEPDIEVIIHLATSGSALFGHVEVCFENKIYSFGNYDMHSRKFFDSIGDGIICIADRDNYINYILNNKKRYLVVFGIQLTKEEKEIIKKRIYNLINDNTIDYYPDLQLYEQGKLDKNDYNDMSSEIYKYANGKFKKIIKGKNKKFFVAKTNCVMVANYILNGKGLKIAAINGIISPGSYYDYLNREFLNKNSNVITRKIYTKEFH